MSPPNTRCNVKRPSQKTSVSRWGEWSLQSNSSGSNLPSLQGNSCVSITDGLTEDGELAP